MKNSVLLAAMILSARIFCAEPQPPDPAPVAEPPMALGWNAEKQSHFPTSLAASSRGEIWVGTEDKGVWRYSPRDKTWTGYTTADGLGDNSIYAVAVDQLGRVWVGHLNHGVSVFDRAKWKNYTSLDGPLGDRIFAIATCPTDGDVWIASDCGLTRYSLKKDDWDYFTRAAGLPSNQVQAIAFDPDGNIVIGTQCDGIALAQKADEYKVWKAVAGPRRPTNAGFGEGLPSSQINAVFVEKDNSIDVATPWGIGSTNDHAETWFYIRGSDWETNVRGLFKAPEPSAEQADFKLMLEDWITALGEHNSRIFAGTRQHGLEIRNAENGEPAGYGEWPSEVQCGWVRAFLTGENIPPLVAIYDEKTGGLKTLDHLKVIEVDEKDAAPKSAPPLPSPAKAPDAKTLQALIDYVGKLKQTLKPGEGYFLGDDWSTQGDWVGRYGREFAKLFGAAGDEAKPADEDFSAGSNCKVEVALGPHHAPEDTVPLRHVQKMEPENRSMLYNPSAGARREADVGDGSKLEKYPLEWEGPDLFLKIAVPDGAHRLSLYFYNNDAPAKQNKFRDYDVELWPKGEQPFYEQSGEPLARARVTDFAGGVYKQFVIAGPGEFQIRVGRSRSFGTRLQGVFIDRLPISAGVKQPITGLEKLDYAPPVSSKTINVETGSAAFSALKLWAQLDAATTKSGASGLMLPFRIFAYRAMLDPNTPPGLLSNFRWQLPLWTSDDRADFDKTMKRAWEARKK